MVVDVVGVATVVVDEAEAGFEETTKVGVGGLGDVVGAGEGAGGEVGHGQGARRLIEMGGRERGKRGRERGWNW